LIRRFFALIPFCEDLARARAIGPGFFTPKNHLTLVRTSVQNDLMTITSFTEAREKFASLLDQLEARGGEFTITRHGKPVAVLVSHDEYEGLIETLNVLSDDETTAALAIAEDQVQAGDLVESIEW
jgi:antitoxin YefM